MKIALTQRLIENATYAETRDALDVSWGSWFAAWDWIPVPLMTGFPQPEKLLDAIAPDALMFTGGNDLATFSDDPLSHRRDQFETALLEIALRRKLPVIGVCRGAQFLAQYFQAKLARIPGHVACRHALTWETQHPLAREQTLQTSVNSFHQMGILEPGPVLQPLAWAPDQTLEAFTHQDQPILGLLWHPERESPFQPADYQLLRGFLETV